MRSEHKLLATIILAIMVLGCWVQYMDHIQENDKRYFQIESKKINYLLENERLKIENHSKELRIRELELIIEKRRDG